MLTGFACGTVVLNVRSGTPMPHMDFISKVLSLRDIGMFTVQELGCVGYRKPEKMF